VQQNVDMRKISAWVAMAPVPTMVAGVYGMNFERMPELHWARGYPAGHCHVRCVSVTWEDRSGEYRNAVVQGPSLSG
jgi:magnesium transporter